MVFLWSIFSFLFFALSTKAAANSDLPKIDKLPRSLTLVSRSGCQHSFENKPSLDGDHSPSRHWGEILYIRMEAPQNVLISSCPRPSSSDSALSCQNIVSASAEDLCQSERNSITVRNTVAKTALGLALTGLGLPPLIVQGVEVTDAAITAGKAAYNTVTAGTTKPPPPQCPVLKTLLETLSNLREDHTTKEEKEKSGKCEVDDAVAILVNTTNSQKIEEINNKPPVTIIRGTTGDSRPYIVTVTTPSGTTVPGNTPSPPPPRTGRGTR
jgi:hypothetical protein